MADTMTFDEAAHEYRLNGIVLPSVTKIIQVAGLVDFSKVPADVLQRAQERGTAIHTACELYDRDKLDYASLDPVVWPYLEAWIKFKQQTGFLVKFSETIVYSRHGYAGRLDRLGMMESTPAIIDIKTSKIISQATGVQTAAYLHACHERGLFGMAKEKYKRFAIHLYDNGKYEIEPYDSPQDWPVFLAALQIYHYHRRAI